MFRGDRNSTIDLGLATHVKEVPPKQQPTSALTQQAAAQLEQWLHVGLLSPLSAGLRSDVPHIPSLQTQKNRTHSGRPALHCPFHRRCYFNY